METITYQINKIIENNYINIVQKFLDDNDLICINPKLENIKTKIKERKMFIVKNYTDFPPEIKNNYISENKKENVHAMKL